MRRPPKRFASPARAERFALCRFNVFLRCDAAELSTSGAKELSRTTGDVLVNRARAAWCYRSVGHRKAPSRFRAYWLEASDRRLDMELQISVMFRHIKWARREVLTHIGVMRGLAPRTHDGDQRDARRSRSLRVHISGRDKPRHGRK